MPENSPGKTTTDPRMQQSRSRKIQQPLPIGCILVCLMLIAGIFLLIFQSASPGGVIAGVARMLDTPVSTDATPLKFSINEGDSATIIGERLEKDGIIRSALIFRTLARTQGVEGKLETGDYILNRSMSTAQVLERLQDGQRDLPLVTIPEGLRAAQIAEKLEQVRPGLGADFRAQLRADTYASMDFLQKVPPGGTVEGYLFPESYRIGFQMNGRDVITMMLNMFEKRVVTSVGRQALPRNLSLHQLLTLASIVERETRKPEERPVIAGVFLNRLARNMMLQADPTVQYAITEVNPASVAQQGYWKSVLSRADLNLDSPYNTYRRNGLPPGPICSPGLASIQATLQPAQTDYLFFVAKPDGSHAFARTAEEHYENVRKFQP